MPFRILPLLLAVVAGNLFSQSPIPPTGAIRLPNIISDHAVLQRDVPLHLWGWATPNTPVTVSLNAHTATTSADRLGEWSAWLPPQPAGGAYSLMISSPTETKTVSDLLLGDVWLASGQSNMEMPLLGFPPTAAVKDSAVEIASANQPNIRLLNIPKKSNDFPLDDQPATWTKCTPGTAARFSAVAYFFGREIAQKEKVAIGLIDSTWGGTPADSWVSMQAFGSDPALIPAFSARAKFAANLAHADAITAADKRDDATAKAAGLPAPKHPWQPYEQSWLPAGLFNGMIAPLASYSIRGFLWYQGETNSAPDRAPFYAHLFQALITDWRTQFGQGDLPFLYVQISSFNSPSEDWGRVRDAQRRALALTNTAMAVTLDVGLPDNVHPPDKQTVATRLALAARALSYHESIEYQSPLFRQAIQEGTGLRVWFNHADGLSSRAESIQDFEVAGRDHQFHPARATLEGETVVVRGETSDPARFVRYAWSGVVSSSLYNAAGLPASTFTSEEPPLR